MIFTLIMSFFMRGLEGVTLVVSEQWPVGLTRLYNVVCFLVRDMCVKHYRYLLVFLATWLQEWV